MIKEMILPSSKYKKSSSLATGPSQNIIIISCIYNAPNDALSAILQTRIYYKLSALCHDFSDSPPAYPLCTPLLDSFVLLRTRGHFARPMLKLKPLANAFSLTVLQSDGILFLLTSVIFSPPMPSKQR